MADRSRTGSAPGNSSSTDAATIRSRDLEVTYTARDGSRVHALGPLNIDIDAGEFVSVVGPSGCGKSTLLRVIAGLATPTRGSALLGGQPVSGSQSPVSVVFQNAVLLPWRTILDNVLLPLQVKFGNAAPYRHKALELLQRVGLGEFARRYPYELSGGMQQRVSIVRALITDPGVLLMDEPFGALDAMTRDQMNLQLLSIWQHSPKTVLFITHGISEAVFLSDRVIVMSGRPGQVLADIRVDLPRPRTVAHMALPAFGQLSISIRELFHHPSRNTPGRESV